MFISQVPFLGLAHREDPDMAKKDVGKIVKDKSKELKEWFTDMDAKLEDWKFTVEESKEGMRVEMHAVAFVKHGGKE
jgi:hypothetical protein